MKKYYEKKRIVALVSRTPEVFLYPLTAFVTRQLNVRIVNFSCKEDR